MKTLLAIAVLCMAFCQIDAHAQDSLKISSIESLLDSIQEKGDAQRSFDSLKITAWADSLKQRIQSRFAFDSLNYSSKIDSLENLSLPTEKYTQKLDSVNQKKLALLNEVEGRKNELLTDSKNKLEQWKGKVRQKLGVDKLSGNIPSNGLPGGSEVNETLSIVKDKMPDVNGSIPDLNGNFPDLKASLPKDLDLPEMPSLSTDKLKNLDLSTDLSSINDKISFNGLNKLDGIKDRLGNATESIAALKDLQSNPDKAIEGALENVKEFDAVKDQLNGVEAIKDNEFVEAAEKLKDPEALKQEAKEMVVKKAVNHFAGKEQVLQQAMDKMAKYKQKYESINSLSEIKKRPPNAMKGKPLIERIVPGVALQILKNEDLLLDVNPYVGYRISGRITSGAGWNQRIGYSLKHDYFTSPAVIYGPRIFAEVKGWRGFVLRAEAEIMNTKVPPALRPVLITDINHREWVKSAFVGIKKEYRFIKNVRGTAFLMFNVYNDHRKSPYGDVVNSRFGFEFPMKKKVKNASGSQ